MMTYTDTQRMELRSHVNLAGDAIARLWPMRTFISRNPLQGLEHLPFHEAVERGEQLFGGRGYLPSDFYREAFHQGRIQAQHLNDVLRPLASDKHVVFGHRGCSHLDVLRAAMIHEVDLPALHHLSPVDDSSAGGEDWLQARLKEWLKQTLPAEASEGGLSPLAFRAGEWLSRETLAAWCDHTLGTDLTDQINRQLIKWCAAFCDEGEATWAMPGREQTFYRAWKAAAQCDLGLPLLGIAQAREKISALPDQPEDALLDSLDRLNIPHAHRQDYLALHLAALPGWVGFIKWRAEQSGDPWQDAYRIDLVKYLAVRLFYEREWVDGCCRKTLGCEGTVDAIDQYAGRYPHAIWLRREKVKGSLPQQAAAEAARLRRRGTQPEADRWEELGRRWYTESRLAVREASLKGQAQSLISLARALDLRHDSILSTRPSDLATLLTWLRDFSARQRSLKWLEAYELMYQQEVLRQLLERHPEPTSRIQRRTTARPFAQFVFCIDVRSEVIRRHIEGRGGYDTLGFAGFFGLPVSFRSLDDPHESALCPVLLRPKHLIREVPRAYQGERVEQRKVRARTAKTGHALLHDLKQNVITPYVMVEAVGWLFGIPLLAKTLWPRWSHRVATWWRQTLMPAVATTVTIDKLTKHEAEEMVAAEQRLQIARWVRRRYPRAGSHLTVDVLEGLRCHALASGHETVGMVEPLGALPGLPDVKTLVEELRRDLRLTARGTSARLDRITQTGFTLNEQAYYVETSLRLMGLTESFARLVVLCGHGSTSQNNPYESSLDCGACGGGHGLPNARAFAMMANRLPVRDVLAQRGIAIPADTHFVAALHNTTTDHIHIADLEDVPATHRKELTQMLDDLQAATAEAVNERSRALSSASDVPTDRESLRAVEQRSLDWAQVRPEWGLAKNSLFIIASRRLTEQTDLGGRSFLHSYDHRMDEDGKLLEIIMTAPLIVAQWINMEYYFSTVDPDVYGSGSKVYHNVTGRLGVMAGNQSDLRMGLPVQTVLDGRRPYHEPVRLTTIIEAPRDRITRIINRQPLLARLFHNRWLLLIACEPGRRFYRYQGPEGWSVVTMGNADGREPVASDRQLSHDQGTMKGDDHERDGLEQLRSVLGGALRVV